MSTEPQSSVLRKGGDLLQSLTQLNPDCILIELLVHRVISLVMKARLSRLFVLRRCAAEQVSQSAER